MSATPSILRIRIPHGLPELLVQKDNRKLLRPVLALLHLKALYKHGRIVDTPAGRREAANNLRISPKQLGRYLNELEANELVSYPENGAIHFASWEDLTAKFNCSRSRYHLVPVMERERGYKMPEKWRTTNALDWLIFSNRIELCKRTYFYKLSKAPGAEQDIKQVAGSLSKEAILQAQINCFLTNGASCDEEYRYQLMCNRADFAVGVKGYGRLYGLTPQAISYKKKKLQALGMIQVEKRRIELTRTKGNRQTFLGIVPWDSQRRKPVLNLPDSLKFYPLSFSFNQAVEKAKENGSKAA